jgi:hypothetical protein
LFVPDARSELKALLWRTTTSVTSGVFILRPKERIGGLGEVGGGVVRGVGDVKVFGRLVDRE